MYRFIKFLLPLCLLFVVQNVRAQFDYCFQQGTALDLSTLDFPGCSGALTYDISGGGLDCTDCPVGQDLNNVGLITITANSGGNECDDVTVNVVANSTITLSGGNTPNCNEYTFSGNASGIITDWNWDFDSNGQIDATSQNGNYEFSQVGNQTITLTTVASNGCETTATVTEFINGPIADLTFQGNPDGDNDYIGISTISFAGNECTIPFCVDDITNTHCIRIVDNTPNASSTNQIFNVTVDGAVIYNNAAGVAPVDISHCFDPDDSGYFELVYTVTDQAGCISTKSYQIYLAEFSSPDADLLNLSAQQDAYCVDETLSFEYTADALNPEGVTYIFAIGCNISEYDPNELVYVEELTLSPGGSTVVSWDVTESSCQCPNGRFKAYAYVFNPCNTEPIESVTVTIEVALDTQADFTAPETLCEGNNYSFSWEGGDDVGNSFCDADAEWSIDPPTGATIDGAGDQADFDWTFDQVGTYEVCLDIMGDCISGESQICETICVQEQLTDADVPINWPTETVFCQNGTYSPSLTLPALNCDPAMVSWSVTPNTGVNIQGNSTESPTITFSEKGDYTVRAQVTSDCGNPFFTSPVITVGGEPTITANGGALSACPDETICLDESFCVDDCNADFTVANVSVYEGTITNCNLPISNTLVWQSSGNPLVNFPNDMQGATCSGSNTPCDFSWTVPSSALANYTVVVEVENLCGSDFECIPITVNIPGSLIIPIPDTVCEGYTIDPSTTLLSNCDWLVNGTTAWQPGDTGVITINAPSAIVVNCNSGACPQSASKDIGVFPNVNLSVSGAAVICSSGTLVLSGFTTISAAPSLQWYEGSCDMWRSGTATELVGETGDTYTANSAGTYAAVNTDLNGCETCAEHTVSTETGPTDFCGDLSYCETDATATIGLSCLNIPSGGTLIWSAEDSGGNVINSSLPSGYTVGSLLTDAGGILGTEVFTIRYEFTSSNGCEYTGNYEVTIQQLGVNPIIARSECFQTEFTLTGGVSDNWGTGTLPVGTFSIGLGHLQINNTLPVGIYTGITYDSGCSQQPYSIEILELPTVNVNGNTFICDNIGSTQNLSASAAGIGTLTYQWFNGDCSSTSQIAGAILDNYAASAAGDYSVIVTDGNGCESCDFVTLILDESPVSTCVDLLFCETEVNEQIGLACLSVPLGGNLDWELTDSGNNVVSSGMSSNFTVTDVLNDFGTLTANEIFTASYEFISSNNCMYSGSYDVTIEDLGIGAVISLDTCRFSEFSFPGAVGGNWDTGDLPAGTFDTSNGDLNVNSTLPTGTYNGITFDSGCSQQPYSIIITDLPVVSITGEDHLCDNDGATQAIEANATGVGSLSYQWVAGDCASGSDLLGESSAQFTLDTEGRYSVNVTDANGCMSCAELEVLLDERPVSICTDQIYCENLGDIEINLSCINLPAGSNTPQWIISSTSHPNFPHIISALPYTVDDLLTVADPVEIAVQQNELFLFYHQWESDDGCVYLDSIDVTILDESVQLQQLDYCSGDEINLGQADNGDWIWSTIPASSTDALATNNFTWIPQLADAGNIYQIRYTSEVGCGAVDYEIQVHATPEVSISTPDVNMCILTDQVISIDQGIAENISIDYEFGINYVPVSTVDLIFSPTDLNITNTDPSQLRFTGSLDYTTLVNSMITCSAEAFQSINIVDTLASLSVPPFICQGEEFSIDVCNDPDVDSFNFDLGGVMYTLNDCPFEIPTLFGTQAYDLEATYGSAFALQCQVQDAGMITIQQQLEYEYETTSIPCTAEQEVVFTITSGNTTSIRLLPSEILSNDVLEIGDVFVETLTFTPVDLSIDEEFPYQLEITDGVCTTDLISDIAQYIAPPELGISIDELVSDFDGCGEDLLTMQISVPNTNFIDSTLWTISADYFPFEILSQGIGLTLPDVIQLLPPPLETSEVVIAAVVYNQCGMDTDTIRHVMNPTDIQLQIEELESQVCPGETIQVSSIINLDVYDLDAMITPTADFDWNPLTETIVVGPNVPAGDYTVTFTATGECGIDIADATFSVFEFYSAEFDVTGFTCIDETMTFTPINAAELSGFQWDFGDMNTANNQFPSHVYDSAGTYEVTLSAFHSGANCQVTYTDEVEIGGGQVNIVPGNTGYCGASQAAYSIDYVNPQSVEWSITNPYTGEIIEYQTDATPLLEFDFDEDSEEVVEYVISTSVIDALGCPSDQTVIASVYPAPKAEIGFDIVSSTGDVSSNFLGSTLQVYLGIPCGDVQVDFFNRHDVNNCFWYNNLGETCDESFDNCSTLSFCTDSEFSGDLSILVDNEYQCQATDEIKVEFICADEVTLFVPNSFTPNYDGVNDVFQYSFKGVVEEFEMFIFDRWGEEIYYSKDLYEYWDGSDEGGEYFVPNGVYNWLVIINGEKTDAIRQRGHVTIMR